MTKKPTKKQLEELEVILLECAIRVGSGLRGMQCEPSATKYWKVEFSKTILKALQEDEQWKGKLRNQGLAAAQLLGQVAARYARQANSTMVKKDQAIKAKKEVVKKCFAKRAGNGYVAAGVWCEI